VRPGRPRRHARRASFLPLGPVVCAMRRTPATTSARS
jgi:hypothetical protein